MVENETNHALKSIQGNSVNMTTKKAQKSGENNEVDIWRIYYLLLKEIT